MRSVVKSLQKKNVEVEIGADRRVQQLTNQIAKVMEKSEDGDDKSEGDGDEKKEEDKLKILQGELAQAFKDKEALKEVCFFKTFFLVFAI